MRQKKLVYYGKKCLIFLISVFILSVAVFYVARLAPGDPLISYYGDRTEKMSPEEREWAEEKLGLNDKISVQYGKTGTERANFCAVCEMGKKCFSWRIWYFI